MPPHDYAQDACYASKAHDLYEAQRDVADALQQIEDAQEGQREQRQIARVSGVRNLAEEHALGSQIVGARQLLADAWKRYKAAGGTTKNARDVTDPGRDPCLPKLP